MKTTADMLISQADALRDAQIVYDAGLVAYKAIKADPNATREQVALACLAIEGAERVMQQAATDLSEMRAEYETAQRGDAEE